MTYIKLLSDEIFDKFTGKLRAFLIKTHPFMADHHDSISREQGDINQGALRDAFIQSLGDETKHLIEEDARYFLHQALSTPVMNVLTKTEGAWIEDMDGKRYLDLHGNGVHNAGFSNPEVIEAAIRQLKEGRTRYRISQEACRDYP
jgi:hypothetical protein